MKIRLSQLLFVLSLTAGSLIVNHSFGQYYPGGGMGGYGRGYGGYGGGMSQGMTNTPRSIPNIAGDLANKETKWLKDNLSLSKDQLKEVKNLNNEYARQQQDAIKDILGKGEGRPSPEQVKSIQDMMMMLNEEKEDKLKPILTADQWNLYQSKKEAMQKEVGGFRPPALKKDSTAKATN